MRNQPSAFDDYLDTRKLRRYLEELESDRDTSIETFTENRSRIEALEALEDVTSNDETELIGLRILEFTGRDGTDYVETGDWDASIEEDYRKLKTFYDELESNLTDCHHGVQLISDEKFEDYARQLAEDSQGKELCDASWPFDHIDWEAAATALQSDYTSFEWEGYTFWGRS